MSRLSVSSSASAALNTADVGYDLILLWGQSNMSGRGAAYDTTRYDPSHPRVQQWGASGTYAGVISQAVEPLAMKDVPTGIGPGLVFARWYLNSAPVNRRVLLVPSALGGTQLSSALATGWRRGVAGGLYAQAVAQAQAALAAAGANARITAILWIQGETDGDNGISGSAYQTDLDALITGARTDLGVPNLPFVMGQMVPEYLATGTRAAINTIHLATPSRVTGVRVAPGVIANNNNDGNHYNAIAQRILGRGMFDAYQRILTGAADPTPPSVPGQTTGLATSSVGATALTLTWAATTGAASYNVQQKTTAGPTFSTIATTTGLTVNATGLTTGTSYDFRVIPVSTAGPGTVSATVSATPVDNGLGQSVATSRAYSLRLVVPGYAGSAVKVRRSSDSTTQDIGFTSGALDTASLLTFCGAGDGFVDTWYDQSGNTRHLTQVTTGAQPKLVSSGAVITSGGKPAVTFDGVDDVVFSTTPNLFAAGSASVCGVLNAATPVAQKRWWAEAVIAQTNFQYGLSQPDNVAGGGLSRARPLVSIQIVSSDATYQGSGAAFNGAIHQISATDTGTAMAQWLDAAVDLASVAYTRGTGEPTRDRFALGGVVRSGSLAPLAMTFSEAVFWASALGTLDRTTAETNQKAFYGTP